MASLQLEDSTFAKGVFIPAAGVRWFVTLFGRDSLVVSMQGISGYPEFAAGALRRLSELQATADDPERDGAGQDPDDTRHGELAELRILPFDPYYGTHDATSLFVIVISYLYQWLGDEAVLERYLPNAEAALRWIDQSGDHDKDGFQEYKILVLGLRMATGTRAGRTPATRSRTQMDHSRRCRSRCASSRATSMTRSSEWPISTRSPDTRKSTRLRAQARELYDRFNETFLVGGRGDLLPRPRRRQATDRERRLQCRADRRKRDRAAGAGESGSSNASWRPTCGRAAYPDARTIGPRRVQPVQLSDGLGLAARQCTDRWWFPALRPRRPGGQGCARHVRGDRKRFQANRLPELFAGLPRDAGSFPVQYLGAPASRRHGLPARSSGWL